MFLGRLLGMYSMPATFDIEVFMTNATAKLKEWGGALLILIGVVMMVVAIWQIAKGLIQHGRAQTNWAIAIILLILGGALASFGAGSDAFGWLSGIAAGGKNTIEDLGGGSTGLPGGTILRMLSGR